MSFLVRLRVHHGRVDFLPLEVGEADVLSGEGVGEITWLEVWYVGGSYQVEEDTVGSPASRQLDTIAITKLVKSIRIFVIAV